MNTSDIGDFVQGKGPLVGAAIHDGHRVRNEVRDLLALSSADCLREEDPHTGAWAEVVPTRVIGTHSRFQVDLNRPREKAVYRTPEDAWGLNVWKTPPPAELIDRSLGEYDRFYAAVGSFLEPLREQHGHFVVLDLHTYNHRREGPAKDPADPEANPEVNIGTGTMDRAYWAPVVDRFIGDLRAFDYGGRSLDVRENVKFRGGGFGRWIHDTYPRSGCAIAIEFKKFFMDEWTGELDSGQHALIKKALESTLPGLLDQLNRLKHP